MVADEPSVAVIAVTVFLSRSGLWPDGDLVSKKMSLYQR